MLEGAHLVLAWTAGAPAELAGPEVYDAGHAAWELDALPIIPEPFALAPTREADAARQLEVLRAQVRRADVDRVVNACEPCADGARTFAWACELAQAGELLVERVLLESLARPAIRRAFADRAAAPVPDPAAESAISRAEADWLVGVNGTRAATVRARALGGRITIERLPIVVLALLVERERAIEAFAPETTYELEAAFEPRSGSARVLARGHAGDDADARRLVSLVRGRVGVVRVLETHTEPRPAPTPFGLVELECQLAEWHGLSARRTVAAALECYDRAVLTHPRATGRPSVLDGAELGEIAARVGTASARYRDVAARIAELAPPVLPAERHLLLPTNGPHDLSRLGDDAGRVYDAVARRFLAAWLPPARLELTAARIEVEGVSFHAGGLVVLERGWYDAYDDLSPADDPHAREPALLREGDELVCARVEPRARPSSPPERFGDGTLVAALGDAGLDSIAEHPAAIERLIALGYVQRDAQRLRPTARGIQVIDLIGDHAITSPAEAGKLERRLLAVERGAESRAAVMSDVVARTRELVEHLRSLPEERTRFPRRDLGIVCPRCGDGTLIENRKGYGCSTWRAPDEPGCGFVIWKTIAGRSIDEEVVRELVERGRTRELTGFRSRAGRPFRAHLVLQAADERPVTFAFGPPGATGRTRA